jgi:hypothetical protein
MSKKYIRRHSFSEIDSIVVTWNSIPQALRIRKSNKSTCKDKCLPYKVDFSVERLAFGSKLEDLETHFRLIH